MTYCNLSYSKISDVFYELQWTITAEICIRIIRKTVSSFVLFHYMLWKNTWTLQENRETSINPQILTTGLCGFTENSPEWKFFTSCKETWVETSPAICWCPQTSPSASAIKERPSARIGLWHWSRPTREPLELVADTNWTRTINAPSN